MKWKPFKWLLISLLTLFWVLWSSSCYFPAQADPVDPDPDIFKFGGDLVITAPDTPGDAFTIGGDLTLQQGNTVQGDVFAIGGTVTLEDDTQVGGDVFAIGGEVMRAESAIVNGSEFVMLGQFSGLFDRFGVLETLYLGNVLFWGITAVIAAIAGVLLLALMPQRMAMISTGLGDRPFTSLLYGLGGFAALFLLSVLVSGSVLGALLLPLANLAALVTGLLGSTAMCVWIGDRIRQRPNTRILNFGLGLALLFLISLIPIVGGLLVSFITFFGFGATLLTRYGTQTIRPDTMGTDRLEPQPE